MEQSDSFFEVFPLGLSQTSQKKTFGIMLAGGAVFGSNVVNVESWRCVATLRGHEGDILDVAWSPGGVWLAST